MDGKLRNMTSIYLTQGDKILLLYRQGGRVVSDTWVASAGGHFEPYELNDARACVLRELQEEIGLTEDSLQNLRLRYVTLRRTKGEIRQNYYFLRNSPPIFPLLLPTKEPCAGLSFRIPNRSKCRLRQNLFLSIIAQSAAKHCSYTAA